jgi:hypothetical protein
MTATATPEFRAEGRRVIAAADAAGVVAYGLLSTGLESMAVANSHASAPWHRTVPRPDRPDGSGGGSGDVPRRPPSTPDHRRGGARARSGGQARHGRRAVALDPGDYTVVLEEYAVVDLPDMLAISGSPPSPSSRSGAAETAGARQRARDYRRRRLRPGRAALRSISKVSPSSGSSRRGRRLPRRRRQPDRGPRVSPDGHGPRLRTRGDRSR